MSQYIVHTKPDYYRLLQGVRTHDDWESWIIYMLNGIEQTSKHTIKVITGIRDLMMDYKHRIRDNYAFYSQDLINHLFRHPYTKINYLRSELHISRPTATKYLDTLAGDGFLEKVKEGRTNYFINTSLLDLLTS